MAHEIAASDDVLLAMTEAPHRHSERTTESVGISKRHEIATSLMALAMTNGCEIAASDDVLLAMTKQREKIVYNEKTLRIHYI